jgi:uncharacterized protein
MDLERARNYIITRLGKELNPSLYYHTLEHTLDVQESVIRLCRCENTDTKLNHIIQTAALFHDAGMIITYEEHEVASVDIAREILPQFLYTPEEIDLVSDLILVTRLPQRPKTHAEEIICDADLDNLGRQDFFLHSFRLKLEWELNGILTCDLKEWLHRQVKFLEDHDFFTADAIATRQEKKMKNLAEIKKIIQDHF